MDLVDHNTLNSNPFAAKSKPAMNLQNPRQDITLKTLSFASYQPLFPPQASAMTPAPVTLYKECLKNHAASLGGHALDGCGEFMPSSTNITDLKCAACGCHRNFHRQETTANHREPPHPQPSLPPTVGTGNPTHFSLLPRRFASSPSTSQSRSPSPPRQLNPPPPPPPPPPAAANNTQQYSHMLMALSTGKGVSFSPPTLTDHLNYRKPSSTPAAHIQNNSNSHHHQTRRNRNQNPDSNPTSNSPNNPSPKNNHSSSSKRKRFRSKFSDEQKEKMRRFAEGLSWKMQRTDEKAVSEFCEEVGVSKGVLKVWMHNNKNTVGKVAPRNNSNSNHSSSNDQDQDLQQGQEHSNNDDSEDQDHEVNVKGGYLHHHLAVGNNRSSCSA